ncbi:MAG: DUF1624 domain-containing protein [Acidobacteria bacterium]|nr:DUF1624 domain-containing protein [Acidobacteriota bacterium]
MPDPNPLAEQQRKPAKPRLLFVDIVRGIAVLAMIEAHVSNATILNTIRRTPQFHHLDLFNGFVSACFIFISGFSICLVVEQRLELFLRWKKPLWMQIRRLLFILVLGYWLHTPVWSLRRLLRMDERLALSLFRSDVLMAITLSLLFCLCVAMTVRRRDAIAITLGALALVVVFWTPFLYDTDPATYVSPVIGTYLTAHQNNLFPLFPSSAYAFAGYFLCWVYLRLRSRGKDLLLFSILLPSGLIMLVGALALFYAPLSYHVYADPSKSSPRHFMMKLGAVLLTVSLVWFYERLAKPQRSYLNMVGQESLFVYALHLMIVYGCVFTPHSFARDIGNVLTYLPSFTLSALLIAAMCPAGICWHVLKRDYPRAAKGLFYGAVAFWLTGLIANP